MCLFGRMCLLPMLFVFSLCLILGFLCVELICLFYEYLLSLIVGFIGVCCLLDWYAFGFRFRSVVCEFYVACCLVDLC